jgi:hypothetical protein
LGCASTGEHFNYDNPGKVLVGDLGFLSSDAFGNSVGKNRYTYLRLTGQYSVSGLSIVIHSPVDGNGNSDRIACGSINLAAVSSDSSGHGHPVEMTKKGPGAGSITMIIISIFFTIGLLYWYFFLMHKDKGHSKLSKSEEEEEDVIVNQESTLNVIKKSIFNALLIFLIPHILLLISRYYLSPARR